MVMQQASGKVLGTYRLRMIQSAKQSYAANEFIIDPILNCYSSILELGRASILPEHRTGSVIGLLWRGIAEYMNLANAELLLGCSSLFECSAKTAHEIFYYFRNNDYLHELVCQPKKKFRLPNVDYWHEQLYQSSYNSEHKQTQSLIPNLLMGYLKMGAKICSLPAWDRAFNCVDFLTIAHKDDLMNSSAARFFKSSNSNQISAQS